MSGSTGGVRLRGAWMASFGGVIFAMAAPASAGDRAQADNVGPVAKEVAASRDETPAPAETSPSPAPASPVSFKLVASQFVDAPVSGDAPSTLRYAGRADAYVDVKGSGFGLDDSWTLTLRP